ncbi:MAG: hypothetical protein ACWGQW_00005 [bacterium]
MYITEQRSHYESQYAVSSDDPQKEHFIDMRGIYTLRQAKQLISKSPRVYVCTKFLGSEYLVKVAKSEARTLLKQYTEETLAARCQGKPIGYLTKKGYVVLEQ